jgi:hypothetical protein
VTSINDKWIGLNGISARPLLKAVVWITVWIPIRTRSREFKLMRLLMCKWLGMININVSRMSLFSRIWHWWWVYGDDDFLAL